MEPEHLSPYWQKGLYRGNQVMDSKVTAIIQVGSLQSQRFFKVDNRETRKSGLLRGRGVLQW